MLGNTIGRLVQKTIRARASMQSVMGWNAKGDRSEKKEPRASGAPSLGGNVSERDGSQVADSSAHKVAEMSQ